MEIKPVAIVTGASQGIGQATALRLARDFLGLVLVARCKENLEKTASDVKSAGAEVMVCALDLREPQAAETVVTATLERFGRIDALLNIAGAVPQIDLFQMTDTQWDDAMALKLHGARRLTIQAWDALKASSGSVVLMSGSGVCEEYRAAATIDVEHDRADKEASKRIECPMLHLWAQGGPLDTFYAKDGGPLGISRQWAPRAQGQAMRGGHFFPEENPDDTAVLVKQFLSA